MGMSNCVAQPLEVGQDLRFPLHVECCERLVHEQQAWTPEQRPGDGDPLTLASGEMRGSTIDKLADPQEVQNDVEAGLLRREARTSHTITEVAHHREVREETRFLEDDPDRPAMGRDEDAPAFVLPDIVAEDQATVRCTGKPGDAAQNRRLAGTRRPEQHGYSSARQIKVDVQFETREVEFEACADPSRQHGLRHRRAPSGGSIGRAGRGS
jgi:hypothetical protein